MSKCLISMFVLIWLMFGNVYAVEIKLTDTSGAIDDQFGWSVSISGDYAVVGAPRDDDDGSDSGSAFIFNRNQGGADNWGMVIRLNPGTAGGDDGIGKSISIEGDYVIVGAPFDDDDGSNSGSAYIFNRNLGGTDNWGEVTKLTAADAAAGDLFGISVSISDTIVVVGAESDDRGPALTNTGAAYVFYKDEGGTDNWGQVTKIEASDAEPEDLFGHAVSVGGENIVVGAWGDDDIGNPSGAVYVYNMNEEGTNNWGQQVKKIPTISGVNWLGTAVDISGDFIVASAPRDDSLRDDSGKAYIYQRNQGGTDNWGLQSILKASNVDVHDRFGGTSSAGKGIAISGNYIVVGAYQEDPLGVSNAGSIYSFLRSGTNWNETSNTYASDGASNDWFGLSVDIDGDYSIVGSYRDNSDQGSAYIYSSGSDLSLPVSLISFTANGKDSHVILKWITQSEVNNAGFILERANERDGEYEMIATYQNDENLRGAGNSSIENQYIFFDETVINGNTYWYKLFDVNLNGARTEHFSVSAFPHSSGEGLEIVERDGLPQEFAIQNNYPNPFNPETTIKFDIPGSENIMSKVTLSIFNSLGQKVRTLISANLVPNSYLIKWNGKNELNQIVPSGLYFAILQFKHSIRSQKMMLIK